MSFSVLIVHLIGYKVDIFVVVPDSLILVCRCQDIKRHVPGRESWRWRDIQAQAMTRKATATPAGENTGALFASCRSYAKCGLTLPVFSSTKETAILPPANNPTVVVVVVVEMFVELFAHFDAEASSPTYDSQLYYVG